MIRKLAKKDFSNKYFDLLDQLSSTNQENITYDKFELFINQLNNNHNIYVIEKNNKIIASGTLLIENKIIHNFGKVGHIEDIVVDFNERGSGLGKLIINHLIETAKNLNCYKIILNCNESNVKFYEKCGFTKKELEMVIYF